jgi:hypothetical protein
MSRPRDPRRPDPEALFDVPGSGRPRTGRHERQADAAIRQARKDRTLTPVDGSLASTIRALARAVDQAERTDQPYAVAQLARELRACLVEARMTPSARGVPDVDPFAALLDGLDDDAHAST